MCDFVEDEVWTLIDPYKNRISSYTIHIQKLLQSTQSALRIERACAMLCCIAPEVYNPVHFYFDEKNVSRHSQSIDYEDDVPWRAVQSSTYMVKYIFRPCNSIVWSPYTFNNKTVTQSSSTLYKSIVFLEYHHRAHSVPTQRLFKIRIL
jgi:hypothetical protein